MSDKAAKQAGRPRGGRPKLPAKKRLSETVFVLLAPAERRELDRYARQPEWKSRSRIMRQAFREWLERQEAADRERDPPE